MKYLKVPLISDFCPVRRHKIFMLNEPVSLMLLYLVFAGSLLLLFICLDPYNSNINAEGDVQEMMFDPR